MVLFSYLRERKLTEVRKDLKTDVPQGGIISSLLFSISVFMSPLYRRLTNTLLSWR